MAELNNLLEKFSLCKETLTDKEQPLVFNQELVLTKTTRSNLEKILYPIVEKRNVLLMGDAGVGKNALVYYINFLRNLPTIRFGFNQDTLPEDLIGSFQVLVNTFSWRDGPLLDAVRKGYTFVADEMNLASPEILKRFIHLLQNYQLNLLEKDGSRVQAHPRFHFVATQNPSRGFEGRKVLPKQIQRLFTVIYLDSYSQYEEVEILSSLFPMFNIEQIKFVVMLQRMVEAGIREGKIAKESLEHYHFNLRNEQRFFRRIQYVLSINNSSKPIQIPEDVFWNHIFLFYINSFPKHHDQTKVFNFLQELSGDSNSVFRQRYKHYLKTFEEKQVSKSIVVDQETFYQSDPLLITPTRNIALNQIEASLESKENLLIEAEEGVRVSELVMFLARIKKVPIRYLCLSKGMHTSDLIGALRPSDKKNDQIAWIDGPLVEGLRTEEWILLENIEVAGNELIEKLNMLLDDASQLTLPPEANEAVIFKKGNARIIIVKYFRATRSQATVSRAFRNRFFSLILPQIPDSELIVSLQICFKAFLPDVLESEEIEQMLFQMVEFHKAMNLAILSKTIGKHIPDVSLYQEENLLRWLKHLYLWLHNKESNIRDILFSGCEVHYLSSLPTQEDRIWGKKLLEQICAGISIDKIQKQLLSSKKKMISSKTSKTKGKITWDPARHFRKPNTGKAKLKMSGKDLKKGININTPETGGSTKEGPDAWYGQDTFGNKGVGVPQGGGGAWGYRTQEIFEEFLKKYKPVGSYDMGIGLKDFYNTFGKMLEEIQLDLDNYLLNNFYVNRDYTSRGSRVEIRKYIQFLANNGNDKVFLKTNIDSHENKLKGLEFVFLINKGRRLFNFNYSVASLVALQSAIEVLSDKKVPVRVLGYSDIENSRYSIHIEEYTRGMDTTNLSNIQKEEIFSSMVNGWHGDTIEEYCVIENIGQFFSIDATTRYVICLSDFRGHRARQNIHWEINKLENRKLRNLISNYSRSNYVFLGIQIGTRNLAEHIFEHSVWIHQDNFDSAPLLLAGKLQNLISRYHEL